MTQRPPESEGAMKKISGIGMITILMVVIVGVFFNLTTTAAAALLSQAFDLVREAQNGGISKENQLLEQSIALREAARSEISESDS